MAIMRWVFKNVGGKHKFNFYKINYVQNLYDTVAYIFALSREIQKETPKVS